MPVKEVEDILNKYKAAEEEINRLSQEIEQRNGQRQEDQSKACRRSRLIQSDYKKRNNDLLKDLEVVKSNLRSKAIYSPAEMQWEEICEKYRDEPSLQTQTWRCNIPIFV